MKSSQIFLYELTLTNIDASQIHTFWQLLHKISRIWHEFLFSVMWDHILDMAAFTVRILEVWFIASLPLPNIYCWQIYTSITLHRSLVYVQSTFYTSFKLINCNGYVVVVFEIFDFVLFLYLRIIFWRCQGWYCAYYY